MDKLTREAQEHGEIFESLIFFEKLIPVLSDKNIEKFKSFLDEHAEDHFEFEEKEIFPIILDKGTNEEKNLIEELQSQHKEILDMINQLDKLVSTHGASSSGNNKEKIMKLNTKIIESLLAHARKEDTDIFPIFKKYGNNI